MRKKVSFINPPAREKGLNLGLGYLSSILKEEGHLVRVFDLNNNSKELKDIKERHLEDSGVIGISVLTGAIEEVRRIVDFLENHNITDDSLLVAGGPHVTLNPKQFMENFPEIDVAVKGEGEDPIKEICENENFKSIDGIIYRESGEVKENRGYERTENLDRIPFPDYSCFDSFSEDKPMVYPLITSRGCPYNCKFCSVPLINGKKWRFRSPENILSEIRHALREYEIKKFDILDDNFTYKPSRAKSLCKLLINSDLDITWFLSAGIRADKFDREMAILFKKAGCEGVRFGIESLVESVFNSINKKQTLNDIKRAIRLAKEAGLKVGGTFIIGLPSSSYSKDLKSIERSKKLNLDEALFSLLLPIPHTDIFQEIKTSSEIEFISDWEERVFYPDTPRPVIETTSYSEEEQIRAYFIGNIEHENFNRISRRGSGILEAGDVIFSTLKYKPIKIFKAVKKSFELIGFDVKNLFLCEIRQD